MHWIRAEIHEFVLRKLATRQDRHDQGAAQAVFNLRSMKQGLGTLGADEVRAVARELGVKPEEVVEMETRLGGQDMAGTAATTSGAVRADRLPGGGQRRAGAILEAEQTARLPGQGLKKPWPVWTRAAGASSRRAG